MIPTLLIFSTLFLISAIYNLFYGDMPNFTFALTLTLLLGALAGLLHLRDKRRGINRGKYLATLRGLDKLPIPKPSFKDLLEWLDHPDPPECTNTLRESAFYLDKHELPVESTLEWLKANGACCDCEVILNSDDKYGDEVGRIRVEHEEDSEA